MTTEPGEDQYHVLEPFSFTPAEWLVIFPRPPPKSGVTTFSNSLAYAEAGDSSALETPIELAAAKLRETRPLTRTAFDECIRALDARGLEFSNRLIDLHVKIVTPWSYTYVCLLWSACNIAIVGVIWNLNDGTFTSRQLITGLVAVVVLAIGTSIASAMSSLGLVRAGVPAMQRTIKSLEQLCRWEQLSSGKLGGMQSKGGGSLDTKSNTIAVNGGSAEEKEEEEEDGLRYKKDPDCDVASPAVDAEPGASRLLEHLSNDTQCPCRECVGNLPSLVFWDSLGRSLGTHLSGWVAFMTLGWTAVVYYAHSFWATWCTFSLAYCGGNG